MDYDIGIIGGGLVGSLAALLLSQQGLSVALIDPKQPSTLKDIPDLRVSAITPYSWSLLEKASVTAKLDPQRYGKILSMKIFETEDAPLHFYASEIGREQLGVIIENEVLLTAIQKCFPENVSRIYETAPSIEVLQKTHPCKLYLFAQGGQTSLTEKLGIAYELFDYQETALVFHVESEHSHQHTAHQRFLPKPLAFLPLFNDHWSSIVWTLPTAEAKTLQASPELLISKLQAAFPLLGKLQLLSAVASFPMMAQNALQVAGQSWVLLGDAAHIVHPLAGQGVNIGFRDVAALVQAIQKYPDLTDPALTEAYSKATLSMNRSLSRGFSLIHYFYETPLLSPLRKIGAKTLDRCIPLKRELIKLAIGERFKP